MDSAVYRVAVTEVTKPARRGRWLWVAVPAAVVLLAGGGAYAWMAMGSQTFMVRGDLIVTGSSLKWGSDSSRCAGEGGFSDLHQGTSVVVTDAEGRTVAIGRMDGEGKATRGTGLAAGVRPAACTWTWTVEGVPEGQFFGVEVSHRGRTQYTRAQLNEPIHLRIG